MDLYTLDDMIKMGKYILMSMCFTQAHLLREYKTQKLPEICMEKMKDIVISSLMT